MKRMAAPLLLACGLGTLCSASWNSEHWKIQDEDTIQKTLSLPGPSDRLVIRNVAGYIHLKGTSGSQVRVVAHRLIRAETENDLRNARNDVKLELSEEPGAVSISYKSANSDDWHRKFYEVVYNIEVEAPRQAHAIVSDVSGAIRIETTSGPFDIRNVSGGIEMSNASGSGSVSTVNGPVEVKFWKNPLESSDFKTVNGPIDVYFQPDLSANLTFNTLNGEIYSAFDVPLRSAPTRPGRHIDRSGTGMVGKGGPELSFKTVNGSIQLHKAVGGSSSE